MKNTMIIRYMVTGLLFLVTNNRVHADVLSDINAKIKKTGSKIVEEAKEVKKNIGAAASKAGSEIRQAGVKATTYVKENIVNPVAEATESLEPWKLPNPNKRFDEVTYLGAHNAHANEEDGFTLYKQQLWSLKKQLEKGVRHFLIDIWPYNGQLLLCHGGCDNKAKIQTLGKDFKTLKSALETFKEFLDNHPEEIISLELENYATTQQTLQVIESVNGLSKYLLTRDNYDPAQFDGKWPRLSQLQKDNKRLIIFDEQRDRDTLNKYGFHTQDYIRRNMYGTHIMEDACKFRGAKLPTQTLTQLNYFGTVTSPLAIHNTPTTLKKVWDKCRTAGIFQTDKPTFIAIDFVDRGNAMKWVNELNR